MTTLPFVQVPLGESIPDLHIEKNGKLFDVRTTDSKPLYVVCDEPHAVKYGLSTSQYQDASKGEGTFVIVCNDQLKQVAQKVDDTVKEYFYQFYADVGSMYMNVKWTRNSVDQMFRGSLYNGSLKCYVKLDETDFFDCDKKKLLFRTGADRVTNFSYVSLVLTPAYAWVFNKQIGVHWTAKQVMTVPGRATIVFDPEPDYSDVDDTDSVTSETSTWSLGNFSLSDAKTDESTSKASGSFSLMDTKPVSLKSSSQTTTSSWSLSDYDIKPSKVTTVVESVTKVASNVSLSETKVSSWSLADYGSEPVKKKKTKKILVAVKKVIKA